MTELGPLLITARNKEHAEYLVRSRAEQRGLHVEAVDATGGDAGMWWATVTVTDSAEVAAAARLDEDTQVLHLHRRD
jgi:hypothetical protein